MKKILKYTFALVISLAMVSCSEDYLETAPTSSIGEDQLVGSVENYGSAINGIAALMVTQQGYHGQGFSGMSTVNTYLGELCGIDFHFEALGGYNSANMKLCANNNAAYSVYAWRYLYMIIGNANRVLATIDNAPGDDSLRALYKAQALTFRAYCYQYLVQIFSKRWMDSENGTSDGVVLRLDNSTDPLGLSTLAECYKQIYDDCDDAIELFTQSGINVTEFHLPSIRMAYGVKARAALTREDWSTAATAAAAAHNGMSLMSNNEYISGFCENNSEWIFGGWGSSDENMWYYTFGAYFGYNGYFSYSGGYNVVANRELVDQFNNTDVRKNLFLHQDLFPTLRFAYGTTVYSLGWVHPGLGPDANTLYNAMYDYIFSHTGASALINKTEYYPGMPSIYGQLKFGVTDLPGVSKMCFMRAAEMMLIEAEALCKMSTPDYAAAQDLIFEINSLRDEAAVKSAATGDALVEEILLTRRMELWGEGFSWFDLKRLGKPIERKTYMAADEKGECPGTFERQFAVTVGPNDEGTNDWVWVIPLDETQYNDEIK